MEIKWPIIPTQISVYNEISSIDDNSKRKCLKKGVGLIDNFELKGILTQMSAEFKNPATIVELTQDETQPLFRTDSASYNWELRKTCRILRKGSNTKANPDCVSNCNLNESFCHTLDNLHVNLFKKLSQTINRQNIEKILNENISSESYAFNIQTLVGNNKTDIKVRNVNARIFLEYDCPFLGYRETLFPIFVENRHIVGLLFVGEILLESESDNYNSKRKVFFKYSRENFFFDKEGLIEKKIKETNNRKFKKEEFLTNEKYEKKIGKIIKRINDFEKRLGNELERKKIKYISDKFENYNRKILQIDTSSDRKLNELEVFWTLFNDHFKQIAIDFPVDKLLILSHNKFKIKYSKIINLVFSFSTQEEELSDLRFSVGKIKNSDRNQVISSIENKSLPDGFDDSNILYNEKTDYTKLYTVNQNNNTYIVVFIRYNQHWNRNLELNENQAVFYTFEKYFESFFHIVSLKLTTIHANWNAKINIDTLKIYGHEMAQFFSGLNSIYELYLKFPKDEKSDNYLSEIPKILTMSTSHVYDISRDFESYISQIIATNRRSKYLVKLPIIKRSYFWPYENLFYKWYSANKNQLIKECKNIIIDAPKSTDLKRPKIYADMKMLQHVFYNLVTNAIKYSFRGTKIYIDGQINEANEYVFFVKSFGIEIPKDVDIYSLYTQSEEAKTSGNEGLGIGLYISKQIIIAHEGKIKHTSEKISSFNIPLMWELNILSQFIKIEDKYNIMKDFKELSIKNITSKVVNCNEDGLSFFHPSEAEIKKEINKATFENTFLITIPQNRKS